MPKLQELIRNSPDEWPNYQAFRAVCREGLSAIRPLRPAERRGEDPWNYGSASAPSYPAFGRLRALYTLQRASAMRPLRVLEIAAGDGALCASLEHMLHCETVANDLREDHLKSALTLYSNGAAITAKPGNLFDLSPEDVGLFDLVIACEIVEHVAHTDEFLRQLRRFVAPGGKLFLTTPNGAYFNNNLPTYSQISDFKALEKDQFKPDADGHLFLITPHEMKSLGEQAGFHAAHIDLLATPVITGHCGARLLSRFGLGRIWYWLESFTRRLPFKARAKLCYLMAVVFD